VSPDDLVDIQVLAAGGFSGRRSGRGRFRRLDGWRSVPGNRLRHRDGANNMPDAWRLRGEARVMAAKNRSVIPGSYRPSPDSPWMKPP
jgi:hypothetical protein